MQDPLSIVNARQTPQSEQVPGRSDQVQNNAGGWGFRVDDWTRALRFLILGTDGGTYYVTERDLTKDNARGIIDLANREGEKLVELIVNVSEAGRAPRQNPILFALAACTASTDAGTRKAALAAIPRVCRIGTHLFIFARYVEQFRGWGRGLRTAIGDWYLDKPVDSVAYQSVKYRQREGWSHRDLLRLSHPKTNDPDRANLLDWICRGHSEGREFPNVVNGYELAQLATEPKDWAKLVGDYSLPWEALPDAAMNHTEVWEALLPHTGLTALIRQLGRLTNLGVVAPLGAQTNEVAERLTNADALKKARVHPLQVLTALVTYRQGRGFQGQSTWTPVPKIIDALDEAFYLSFGSVEPADKRTLVALDVSGSMAIDIARSPLTAREASAAMAMVHLRTETECLPVAFAGDGGWAGTHNHIAPIPISAKQRLDDVVRTVSSIPLGRTDCALPMVWAQANKVHVDTFIIYTDNETWSGPIHPFQALRNYRNTMVSDARLIAVGMAATEFTVSDPTDARSLDVVGFDTATPGLINAFSRGDL